MSKENIEKIKELLSKIEEILENSGECYMNSFPEDNIPGRRDWEDLHDDWLRCWYGLEDVKDQLKEFYGIE